jgi:hypothetical protein
MRRLVGHFSAAMALLTIIFTPVIHRVLHTFHWDEDE